MYILYFLASLTTVYYIYNRIRNLCAIKNHTFADLTINNDNVSLDLVDIIYEDYTREFIEDVDDFNFILHKEKPIRYATVIYSVNYKQYSVLFNKENLANLALTRFPFYDNITKMPLYREVKKAVIFIDDIEYDITNELLEFSGPKLNYHSDLVTVRFEEIIDYSQEFPELLNATGIINIEDNFGYKHVYNYPGEFKWKENLLD